jgi:hypothetical protein
MVNALLAGVKSQTRRVVKPQPPPRGDKSESIFRHANGCRYSDVNYEGEASERCPHGTAGDTLWVRESFRKIIGDTHGWIETDYRATYEPGARMGDHLGVKPKWKPSIHMPREASRITLRIVDVRVERLQEISADDAAAEGWPGPDEANTIRNAYPIAWYSHLWDQINGKHHPWASNPWTWALSFEVVK